jgi:hypothetical protein
MNLCLLIKTDPHHAKLIIIFIFQCALFYSVFWIGLVYGLFHNESYRYRHASYSLTYAHLLELKIILVNRCSGLIDLLCSLRMDINAYFFLD